MDPVKTNADIEEFRKATGASSVMLARAAMWNASVFTKEGPLPVEKVMEEYLKYVSVSEFRLLFTDLDCYCKNVNMVSCFSSGDPVRQQRLQLKVLSVSDAEGQSGVSSGETGAGGSD